MDEYIVIMLLLYYHYTFKNNLKNKLKRNVKKKCKRKIFLLVKFRKQNVPHELNYSDLE